MALWTPANLPAGKLKGWWDYSEGATVTALGGTISSVADKSGNGRTMSPSGTVAYSASGPAGESVAVLAETCLEASIPAASFSSAIVLASVWKKVGAATAYNAAPLTRTASSYPSPIDSWDNNRFVGTGTSVLNFSDAGANLANDTRITSWNVFLQSSSASLTSEYINGSLSTSFSSDCYGDTATVLTAGSRADRATSSRSHIGEQVATTGLSDDDRLRLEGYLAWKWGLQGLLPAGHAYKSAAPTVATTYTLAVATAGVTVAGNSVGLKRARRVAVGVAAVSVTGQAVRLLQARKVAVDASAIAVAAQPVALRRSLRLAVAGQAVTAAANAVALTYQRRLAVAAAAVSVVGQPAALRWSHRIAVQTSAVTITANPVTLAKGGAGQLIVATASVAVAASQVRIVMARRLTVAVAPASVSAAPVGLVRSLRLTTASAALTVAAQPVQLRRARTLPVGTAVVAVASAQVGLRAFRRLAITPGAIIVAAEPVSLTKQGAITLPTPGRRTAHGAAVPRLAKGVGTSRTVRGTA